MQWLFLRLRGSQKPENMESELETAGGWRLEAGGWGMGAQMLLPF
jgi:hypothetical protein